MSRSVESLSDGRVTLTPADEVDASDEIRHFDQLSPRAKRAVVAAANDGTTTIHAPSLLTVDVVVFTDYYRVA